MSGGTGSGFLDETIGVLTNISTGGLVGFGEEGFKGGVTGKPIIEGTKEVTGANAAEEANEVAREQFEASKVAAEQDRLKSQKQSEVTQIAASRGAGRARSNVSGNASTGSTIGGGNQTDFLGL